MDRKSDIALFQKATEGLSNVVFIDYRIENYWGGFHSVKATMEALRAALSGHTVVYHRFVLLQGKDYPLHSPEYIHDFFLAHSEEEFCKARNISLSQYPKEYMKCCGYWWMDGKGMLHKLIKKFFAGCNLILKIKFKKPYVSQKKEKWDIYAGWAQFSLTRECVAYLLDMYDNNSCYNKYMMHCYTPDEIYIHTLLYNSQFSSRITNYCLTPRENARWKSELLNLTYFEYPVVVDVFTDENEYEKLKKTGALFVRKVKAEESTSLLKKIDKGIEKEKHEYEAKLF